MKPKLISVPTDLPTPPYPSDTRVKGWRFDIDYERLLISDTWALTSPENRPWLLMIWLTSWYQSPAGTLPNCDEAIAAKIGMDYKLFMMEREHLMRGWRLHSDGLLYHDTVADHVIVMIAKRNKEATRKAALREAYKAEREEKQRKCEQEEMSRGTDAGLPRESHRSPAPTPTPTPTDEEKRRGDARGTDAQTPATTEPDATAVPFSSSKKSPTVKMTENWTPGESTLKWLKDELAGHSYLQEQIISEFRNFWMATGKRRAMKNWDLAFMKNPLVKQAIAKTKMPAKNGTASPEYRKMVGR